MSGAGLDFLFENSLDVQFSKSENLTSDDHE